MKTLEEVLEAWEQDCLIDNPDLAAVSKQTPQLHSKYLAVLSRTKLRLKDQEMQQKILLKNKWLWYNGKMPKEKIDELGWKYDPLDGLKVVKSEMDQYYEADPDIQASQLRIEYLETMIYTIKEIVDTLKWRHQTIRNMVEWKKFETGY